MGMEAINHPTLASFAQPWRKLPSFVATMGLLWIVATVALYSFHVTHPAHKSPLAAPIPTMSPLQLPSKGETGDGAIANSEMYKRLTTGRGAVATAEDAESLKKLWASAMTVAETSPGGLFATSSWVGKDVIDLNRGKIGSIGDFVVGKDGKIRDVLLVLERSGADPKKPGYSIPFDDFMRLKTLGPKSFAVVVGSFKAGSSAGFDWKAQNVVGVDQPVAEISRWYP
jgi:hypothetical protein